MNYPSHLSFLATHFLRSFLFRCGRLGPAVAALFLATAHAANLISNAGFETGGATTATGWTFAGNTSITTSDVHGGSRAIDIKDDSVVSPVARAQLSSVISVNENQSYGLSFWVKWVSSSPATGTPYVQLIQSDGAGGTIATTNLPIAATNSWVQYTYLIGPAGNAVDAALVHAVSHLQIAFYAAGVPSVANQGEIILDDVTLEDTGSVFPNADFSSSADFWTLGGDFPDSSQTIETVSFAGRMAMHMIDTSTIKYAAASQRIYNVDASKLYAVDLDGYAISGSPGFTIRQVGSGGTTLAATTVMLSGAQWNHYSRTIGPMGSGADITYQSGIQQIMISLYGGTPVAATGEGYYSNVILRPAGLIDNGGFENGTVGWLTTGSRATGQLAEISTADTYPGAGAQSLHLRDVSTSTSCSLTNSITVAPSTVYTVTGAGKNLPFGSPATIAPATITIIELQALGEGNYLTIGTPRYLQFNSTSWGTQSVTFTTGATTTALKVLLVAGDNSSYTPADKANPASTGDVLFDGITVTGPDGINLFARGSFENGTAGWGKAELEFDGVEISAAADASHTGTAGLKLYDNSTNDFGAVHQEVKVMPGGDYHLSFWARTVSSGQGGYAVVRQLNADRETVADTTLTIGSTSWTNFALAIGAHAGSGGVVLDSSTRYLLVMFYSAAAPAMLNTATVYIDDIFLFPTIASPVWSATPSAPVVIPYTVQSVSNPFYDSFSGGSLYERWKINSGSPTVLDVVAKSPPYSLQLGGGDSVERAVNLSGYSSLSISYNRKLIDFGTGDTGYVEWFNGTSWVTLETITGTSTDWTAESFTLPASAATADFRVRLRVVGAAADHCNFDDLQIAGAPDVADYFRAPPAIGLPQQPWLGDYLVHAHSLMSLNSLMQWEALNPGMNFPATLMERMRDPTTVGASVVTGHVHSGDEGYWYPTSATFQPGAVEDPLVTPATRDIVGEFADNAALSQVRFVGYHWIHSDRYALLDHPEWASRDYAGHLIVTDRGWALSLSTPYRKYLQNLLSYEDGKAFDGFYFDQFDFAFRTGEQTPQLVDLFKAANPALALPTNNDPTASAVKALVKLSQQVVDAHFYQLASALRAVDPQFATIIAIPNEMTNQPYTFGTADTAAASDTAKNEMGIPLRIPLSQTPTGTARDQALPFQTVQFSLAQVTARDSSRKLPHTWNVRRSSDADTGFLQSMVGLAATNGFYMNFQTLLSPTVGTFETAPPSEYTPAIQYGERLSPDLRGRTYLTWVAVYVSEHLRSDLNAWPALNSTKTAYVGSAYSDYAWPIFGAVQTLQEQHVPWGVVTDREVALGQFDNIRVIVVPHWAGLTATEQSLLSAWQTSGGRLVVQNSDGVALDNSTLAWEDPVAQPTLFAKLWSAITNNGSLQPPIQVVSPSGDPSFRRTLAGFMRTSNGTVVVSLSNSLDWMDVRSSSWVLSDENGTPPAAFDARVIVHGGYTPIWAKRLPGNTALTIMTSGSDKTIDVVGIGIHAVVVLDDEF